MAVSPTAILLGSTALGIIAADISTEGLVQATSGSSIAAILMGIAAIITAWKSGTKNAKTATDALETVHKIDARLSREFSPDSGSQKETVSQIAAMGRQMVDEQMKQARDLQALSERLAATDATAKAEHALIRDELHSLAHQLGEAKAENIAARQETNSRLDAITRDIDRIESK